MSEISRRPWNRGKPRIGMYQSRLHPLAWESENEMTQVAGRCAVGGPLRVRCGSCMYPFIRIIWDDNVTKILRERYFGIFTWNE